MDNSVTLFEENLRFVDLKIKKQFYNNEDNYYKLELSSSYNRSSRLITTNNGENNTHTMTICIKSKDEYDISYLRRAAYHVHDYYETQIEQLLS
ncbi:hypothetical protein HCN44_008534 [Aphidius gifuensis]|uniref:Uncharacterized protein n=1 Tax=Aphidius gifuensis TaxID=684658 RepID=A0A834XQP7_APHGI|nr:hypothetical protein HCN44_008534 [Aphidius gifuensis]